METTRTVYKRGLTRRNEIRKDEYKGITKEFIYGEGEKFRKFVSMEFNNDGSLVIYQGLIEEKDEMGCLQIYLNPDETRFIMETIKKFNFKKEFKAFEEKGIQNLETIVETDEKEEQA